MNILIVTAEQVKEGERFMDDKGWSFAKSFERMGIQTETFFHRKKGRLSFLEKDKRIKGRWRAYMNGLLLARVLKVRPEMLLLLKGETVEAQTLRTIRKKTDTVIVNVFPDNPLLMGNFEAIEPCHLFYVKDTYVVSAIRKTGLRNVHYLPQCTDPEVHRPVELQGDERKQYASGLSLIGSMYPYRERLMEELLEFSPALWGKGWGKASNKAMARLWRGRDVRGSSKAKAICGSDISLNPHHPINDIRGVNRRTFDIAACGGFQIAEYKEDIDGLFKEGEEIICFRSMDELKKLIAHYLAHPAEREAIAKAAYERTLKEHTYDRRAESIVRMAGAAGAGEAV